jgi:hypothetical protein
MSEQPDSSSLMGEDGFEAASGPDREFVGATGLRAYARALGPGLITGASDDDPSGIATYAQAGAQSGFAMLWVALVTLPLMIGVQEICDRTALASGKLSRSSSGSSSNSTFLWKARRRDLASVESMPNVDYRTKQSILVSGTPGAHASAGSILEMEIVEPSDGTEHKWLEWLGLEEPPPEPDSWVPVARGFHIDDVKTGSSSAAARLVDQLSGAGIQARQRSYELDAAIETAESLTLFGGGGSLGGGSFRRVAVGVHNRDRARATEIATQFEHQSELDSTRSDEELTREALDAGPPPEV